MTRRRRDESLGAAVTKTLFTPLALALSVALAAAPARAQTEAAPEAHKPAAARPKSAPTPPAKPQEVKTAPAPAAEAEPVEAPAPKEIDRAEAIRRANAFFNASPVMTADFVQIGADGKRAEGKLHVQRAGRVRFEYAQPATLEVVSDGAQVLVRDRKLNTQSLYFIDQTPLKFLMKEKIDLEHDAILKDVVTDDAGVSILLEDKVTFGGTSRVKLIFDSKSFKLKQWQITDPQGYETLISLFNIDQKRTPDAALFKIDAKASAN
jgi:outer membrane lipoprotein-sorting protein